MWEMLYFPPDGSLLANDEILLLASSQESLVGGDISSYLSLHEHPHLGILFYNIHPCACASIMAELNVHRDHYILRWKKEKQREREVLWITTTVQMTQLKYFEMFFPSTL